MLFRVFSVPLGGVERREIVGVGWVEVSADSVEKNGFNE